MVSQKHIVNSIQKRGDNVHVVKDRLRLKWRQDYAVFAYYWWLRAPLAVTLTLTSVVFPPGVDLASGDV